MNKSKEFMDNGDIYNIGQTINGVSTFLWLNKKWHYFTPAPVSDFEYGNDTITDLLYNDRMGGFSNTSYKGNIFIR
jgi:hypothetical protein